MTSRIERIVAGLARASTWGGAGAIAVMMLGTDWDIAARQIAGAPLDGVVDLVEICVLAVAMLGLPEVFLRDEQIRIDLVDSVLPRHVLKLVRAVGLVLSLIFVLLLARNVWQPMLDARQFGDMKYDLGVRIWPLYAMILLAFALSVVAVLSALWQIMRGAL